MILGVTSIHKNIKPEKFQNILVSHCFDSTQGLWRDVSFFLSFSKLIHRLKKTYSINNRFRGEKTSLASWFNVTTSKTLVSFPSIQMETKSLMCRGMAPISLTTIFFGKVPIYRKGLICNKNIYK
jgi:hypothetical protein